jgi:hypothetical protein
MGSEVGSIGSAMGQGACTSKVRSSPLGGNAVPRSAARTLISSNPGWLPVCRSSGSCGKLTRIQMPGLDQQNAAHQSQVTWLDSTGDRSRRTAALNC